MQSQECTDLNAIMIANAIENVSFIDSYKRLSNQFQLYSDLLSILRKNPKIIALSLIEIEQHCQQTSELQAISSSIFSSLYSDCLLPEDQQLTLLLLKELVNHQLVVSENPLKLIRNGNCAFKIFFKLFTESLIGCKFYLSSSLKDCVFNCLMEDELYLDLEIERASMRYTEEERQRLFGSPTDTENYQAKLAKFKARVLDKLSMLIINFVDAIQQNIHCFPSILFSLFRHTYQRLHNSRSIDEKEAGIICTDLVFAQFICHAILNPELYGIVDINITKMARFNLTQIAHILQVLALSKWQDIDPKLNELIIKIPKKYCLKNFLQTIMQSEPKLMHSAQLNQFNQSLFFNSLSTITNEIKRTCILFSENDLYYFLRMLFQVKNKTTNQYLKKVLDDFLKYLNESNLDKILNSGNQMNSHSDLHKSTSACDDAQAFESSKTTQISKKSILDKMTRRGKNQEVDHHSNTKEESLLNKMSKRSNSKTHLINNTTKEELDSSSSPSTTKSGFLSYNNLSLKNNNFQVLVIPILSNHSALCNDILSEEKVLNIESLRKTRTKAKLNLESNQPNSIPSNVSNIQQSQINMVANSLNNFSFCELDDKTANVNNPIVDNKRSKFNSMSQDQESIGTNDNLEAISEASSIENLNDNLLIEGDNLSDMISANVSSGRATPNVSGRESSSSDSSDDDEDEPTANANNEGVQPQANELEERDLDLSQNLANQNHQANDNQNNQVQANNHNQNAQPNHVNNNNNDVLNRMNQQENRMIVQQRTHEYIEDKFGKFDYKQIVVTQPATDETKSHLSDTWSTDVLASLSSISLISSQLNDTNIPNQLTETINYEFCKKLFRNVFSIVDIQNIPLHSSLISKASFTSFHHPSSNSLTVQNRLTEVQNLLQLLLAEARYVQNLTHSIAIQEALRYLNNFDESLFNKMMQELKDDYLKRSPYIGYLVKCKQNLISAIQHFQTIKSYLGQDKNTINQCLITFYVRKFFMRNMHEIDNFVNRFKQLVLADEKANLIEEFLKELYVGMEQDSDWKYTNEEQMLYGKMVVERNIFSTIYYNAIYPNSEGIKFISPISFNELIH